MPSFDIVSQIDMQELDNAINQALKEIATRYDFRGSKSSIKLEKDSIHLISDDDFKMKALVEILQSKMSKRGISLKAVPFGKVEPTAGGLVKCDGKLIQGIETEKGKEITKLIKDMNLKVQAQIQGEQVRVSGKKKDELQTVMQAVKEKNLPLPLQFTNFRD